MTTLELLHWNDTHGRYDGLARLSARAREIREASPHPVLLLDGGDVEDTSVRLSAMTFGVAGWRVLGAAGVDAAVVGNGGLLRYGPAQLPAYARALGSSPLVCDLEIDGGTPPGAAPSTLLRAGELTVGILGITDYYAQYDVAFGLRERGRVTAVRQEAEALRAAGADVVVLLSHAGINHDRGISWSVRGLVDVIVGGHTHDLLTEGDRGQGIPIAQAGWNAEHLGRIRLEVDDAGVRVADMTLEAIDATATADPVVLAEIEACECDLDAWMAEPVAELAGPVPLDAPDSPVARLVVKALLVQAPADLGVLMGAHLTAGLPAGVVTRRHVWTATSSPGNLARATLTGAQVRHLLLRGRSEEFVTAVPRTFRGQPYGHLQYVGADVHEDQVYVGGTPVDVERTYRVTGSDLELSPYGGLVGKTPADLELRTPEILPEILESHLRTR